MEFDDPIERRRWLAILVANAKGHARKASRPFELTVEFIETLYAQQQGRCVVTGLRFDQRRFPDALVKHPFASSIDRRSSSGGYTTDNVRLVCIAVNFGMGQWGEEAKDNQIVSWAFLLQGHPSDLSLVHEMFHGVADMQIERDGSNYRLRSSRFNVPATAEEARSLAEEIIGEMNGAIKAFFPSREIILVGNTFGCHRDGTFLYYQENRVAIRSEVSLSMTVNGNPIPPQPPPLEPMQWFNLAQRDTNVADALRQFARSDEWFDIYKVYEIIRDDLGKKVNSNKWASKTELYCYVKQLITIDMLGQRGPLSR
jgi:hypothetical protein